MLQVLFTLINAHPCAGSLQVRNSTDVATRKNLMIDKSTKVICQGFTGKQVKMGGVLISVHLVCTCREHCTANRLLHTVLTW